MWWYDPVNSRIKVVYEPKWAGALQSPDNVSVSPRGALLLCEDSHGSDRLKGLSHGQLFDIARNRISHGEFAGCTWSPDGNWLFFNLQRPGATYAVTGPWGRGPL